MRFHNIANRKDSYDAYVKVIGIFGFYNSIIIEVLI